MKKAVVIGSGFSSLSAACYLQKFGFEVTVIEKNEQLGGRASVLKAEGFQFDMGPSWYWMPDIFEKFFNDFGKSASDFYKLIQLDPGYRVYFGENDFIDISASTDKIIQKFEQLDPGSGLRLKHFLKEAKINYKIAMNDLVYQPGLVFTELITKSTAVRLNLFTKKISDQAKKVTKHPQLRSILEFPVLFLGAKPSDTPAFYNFMNHADFGLGTWYPMGGMSKVVEAMVSIGKDLGVKYVVNEEVLTLPVKDEVIKIVETTNNTYKADVVVSGADYAHTEKLFSSSEYKNYSSEYWDKKTFAPSALLYYVGLDGSAGDVLHHNLFFDSDFKIHSSEIYDSKKWPENPLFYLNVPSKTDNSLAEDNNDAAFLLIPTAVNLKENDDTHDYYFNLIMDRYALITGKDIRPNIQFKKSFGIQDFKNKYHSCKGNAYGLANTLFQTSILRPRIKNRNIKNMFYTGQLTVPGPGVPPALISGNVVAHYIKENF